MDTLFKDTMAKVQAKILEEGSIRSFAQRLDMNPTTISRWFAEKRSPDFQSLCTILEYFMLELSFPETKIPGTKNTPHKDLKSRPIYLASLRVLSRKTVSSPKN